MFLFRASEIGHKEIVNLLIVHGADARVHPVTKYSPLYIACYNGHKEIAELLLKVYWFSLMESCAKRNWRYFLTEIS